MSEIFNMLSEPFPSDMLARNKSWIDGSVPYPDVLTGIAGAAWAMLVDFFAEKGMHPALPVPVRDIAKRCDIQVFESALADPDGMERDGRGAVFRHSALQLRESRRTGRIAGVITIEHSLPEYGKRSAIAREIGAYALRTGCVGPLDSRPAYGGPFQVQDRAGRLAALFGRFLLMPPVLVNKLKADYEARNSYNPLSFRDWIGALSDAALVTDHDAMLGYDAFLEYMSFRT